MKAIVFSAETTTTNVDFETQMVKYGFLMADSLCIAGQLGANMLFEKEYKGYSLLKKVQFLYDGLLEQPLETENRELNLELMTNFIAITKKHQKQKNLTPSQLTIYNNSRMEFCDWFDMYSDNIIAFQKKFGLSDLLSMAETKEIETKLTNMSLGGYTHSNHESESNAKMILELFFSGNATKEPTILMLPSEFTCLSDSFREEMKKKERGENVENEEEDKTDTSRPKLLKHVLTMPEIKHLTVLELKALTVQLSEPFRILNTHLEKWILFCKTTNDLIELNDYFIANLLEPFRVMQDVLDKNEILAGLKNNPGISLIENHFYVGVYYVEGIWMMYQYYKVVHQATIYYLQKRTLNNKMYPTFLPIINIIPQILKSRMGEALKEIEAATILEGNNTKKFIAVD